MKTIKYYLLIAATALASCSQDPALEQQVITFTAGIENSTGINTRTTTAGNAWVQGDEIALYMYEANSGTLIAKRKYLVTDAATGALAPAPGEQPLYYPQDGATVDFSASYPYSETNVYSLADQRNPAAIDILYARTPGVAKSPTPVNFVFHHKLSKLTLNVSAGTGLQAADINALEEGDVTIYGMPVDVTLDPENGNLTIDSSEASNNRCMFKNATATFSAIMPPGNWTRTITFTINEQPYQWTAPAGEMFEAGENHIYSLTVDRMGIAMMDGTPVIGWWNLYEHTPEYPGFTPVSAE